jgi:hypothetical protein
MMRLDLGDTKYIRGIAILSVSLFILLRAVKRSPKDRVLFFQTIAFGLFLLVGLISTFGTMPDWFFPLFAIFFFFFVLLAGYFGMLNWLRRRKRTG